MSGFKNKRRRGGLLLFGLLFHPGAYAQTFNNTIAGGLSSPVLTKGYEQTLFVNLIPQPSSLVEPSAQYCFTVASINGEMEARTLTTTGDLNLFAVPAQSSTSACLPRLIKLLVKCVDSSYDCEYRYRVDRF